ncbi:hypothetical protein [Methanobrevibacter sp.]
MSNNTSLYEEMELMITSLANNNPPPILCKITKTYAESNNVDVTSEIGDFTYVKVLGSTEIGLEGVLCFLDGDSNNQIVLTSFDDSEKFEKINEEISELKSKIEDIPSIDDLQDYAKLSDVYIKNQEDFVEKMDITISNLIGRV